MKIQHNMQAMNGVRVFGTVVSNQSKMSSKLSTMKLFDGSLKSTSASSSTSNTSGLDSFSATEVYEIYLDENEFAAQMTPSDGNGVSSSYTKLAELLDKEIVPQAVNAIMNTYNHAFGYLKDSSTGIGLSIINNPSSSSLASVAVSGINGRYNSSGQLTCDLKFSLTVNAARLAFNGDGTLTDKSRENLEGTILHEMVHGFMYESLTVGMLSGGD